MKIFQQMSNEAKYNYYLFNRSKPKFKPGDKIKCIPGGVDIWVHSGKIYEVVDNVWWPPERGDVCYRNCGHKMHSPKPGYWCVIIHGELGKPTQILEDCFEAV